jgi:hypothetical protein
VWWVENGKCPVFGVKHCVLPEWKLHRSTFIMNESVSPRHFHCRPLGFQKSLLPSILTINNLLAQQNSFVGSFPSTLTIKNKTSLLGCYGISKSLKTWRDTP